MTKRVLRYPDITDTEYVYELAVNYDTSNSNRKSKLVFVKCKSKPHKKTDQVTYKFTEGKESETDTEDALRFMFPNACKFCRVSL